MTIEAFAFALLVGGQLAAIVAMSWVKREFYPDEYGNLPPQSTKDQVERFHPSRPLGQWLING
jgi:hypothetical protein